MNSYKLTFSLEMNDDISLIFKDENGNIYSQTNLGNGSIVTPEYQNETAMVKKDRYDILCNEYIKKLNMWCVNDCAENSMNEAEK